MEKDKSTDPVQQMIRAGMERAREKAERTLPSTGFCHWCERPLEQGRLFCSRAHSEAHEAERKTLKELGL